MQTRVVHIVKSTTILELLTETNRQTEKDNAMQARKQNDDLRPLGRDVTEPEISVKTLKNLSLFKEPLERKVLNKVPKKLNKPKPIVDNEIQVKESSCCCIM